MKRAVRVWLGMVLLLTACGTSATPTASTTASPSAAASATSTPSSASSPKPAAGACHPCLALVTLQGSTAYVVRDVSDIDHPRTIANLGTSIAPPQFVSASQISYAQEGRLYTAPLSGSPRSTVAETTLNTIAFSWSPDGKTAAILDNQDETRMDLHLVTDGQDRLAATMPGFPAVFGCEEQQCADRVQFYLGYSADGLFLVWTQTLTGVFRMWTADGIDLTPQYFAAYIATWSGDALYFQDSQGVKRFRNGSVATFMPDVAWIRPHASPAGGQIVYETRDAGGMPGVYVVDTTTARVQLVNLERSDPDFLTSRFLWYRGERRCLTSEECARGGYVATGKTYIYDLQAKKEYSSVITNLYDVWPHAA